MISWKFLHAIFLIVAQVSIRDQPCPKPFEDTVTPLVIGSGEMDGQGFYYDDPDSFLYDWQYHWFRKTHSLDTGDLLTLHYGLERYSLAAFLKAVAFTHDELDEYLGVMLTPDDPRCPVLQTGYYGNRFVAATLERLVDTILVKIGM